MSEGIFVTGVLPGSLSEKAGVKKGDRVISMNGMRITSLVEAFQARDSNNKTLNITLIRGTSFLELKFHFDTGKVDKRVLGSVQSNKDMN